MAGPAETSGSSYSTHLLPPGSLVRVDSKDNVLDSISKEASQVNSSPDVPRTLESAASVGLFLPASIKPTKGLARRLAATTAHDSAPSDPQRTASLVAVRVLEEGDLAPTSSGLTLPQNADVSTTQPKVNHVADASRNAGGLLESNASSASTSAAAVAALRRADLFTVPAGPPSPFSPSSRAVLSIPDESVSGSTSPGHSNTLSALASPMAARCPSLPDLLNLD